MQRYTITTLKNVFVMILEKHAPQQRSPSPHAVFSKLPPLGAQSVVSEVSLPFKCPAHRLWKVALLMREGQSLLHPSLSPSPSSCSPPSPSRSSGLISLSWLAAEGGARGGHINVISLQQMMALREAVTFCSCPGG